MAPSGWVSGGRRARRGVLLASAGQPAVDSATEVAVPIHPYPVYQEPAWTAVQQPGRTAEAGEDGSGVTEQQTEVAEQPAPCRCAPPRCPARRSDARRHGSRRPHGRWTDRAICPTTSGTRLATRTSHWRDVARGHRGRADRHRRQRTAQASPAAPPRGRGSASLTGQLTPRATRRRPGDAAGPCPRGGSSAGSPPYGRETARRRSDRKAKR
jgi:hypothetical protein